MFSLPAIWQGNPIERNGERFDQIDQRFDRIETLLQNTISKSSAQRAGFRESATEVGKFGRGEIANMAQHGGWVAQEEIGRDLNRVRELLTEIAVLSAGFEVDE